MLEPCLGTFRKVEWQVLDDEEIVVHPVYSIGEAEVFQPHDRVGVLEVLDDVRRCAETHHEWCLPDPFCKRLWAASIQAWAASFVPNPRMLAMVVQVAVTLV